MPASPYSVWINILGSVSPSVGRSITQTNRQLAGLERQVIATNRAIRMGFGKLLGFGGALVGITGVVAGMKQAVDLSMQNEQIQENLLVTLRNQRALRHENTQLAVQDLKTLNEQAVRLQQQTGIYKNVYERGAMILAQSRMNVNQIRSMQPVMANLVASQAMQGKSAEQMEQTYKAVGYAIERGMGRSLSRQGIMLTPMEQKYLQMNALTGNIAANMEIVERAINRTYAGMARMRMSTLTGQVAGAMANMRLSMENMGDALKPIGQRLTIIFSQLVTTFEPIITRITKLVGSWLKDHMEDMEKWIGMVRMYVIPFLTTIVDKVAYVLNMFVSGMRSMHEFKRTIQDIGGYLFGTKNVDPRNRGYGNIRRFPKGVVPRAMPVERGIITQWLEMMNPIVDHFMAKTLPEIIKKLGTWFSKIDDEFSKWADKEFMRIMGQIQTNIMNPLNKMIDNFFTKTIPSWWNYLVTNIPVWAGNVGQAIMKEANRVWTDLYGQITKWGDELWPNVIKWINGLGTEFGKSVEKATNNMIKSVRDKFGIFTDILFPGFPQGAVGGGGDVGPTVVPSRARSYNPFPRPGSTGNVYTPTGQNYAGGNASGGLKALNFGPLTDPRSAGGAYFSEYGSGPPKFPGSRLRALTPSDIAVSPGLLQGRWGGYGGGANAPFHMGETGRIVDAKGNIVPGLEHVKIADTSWIRTGKPTYNTFEQRKYRDMSGKYQFVPDTGTAAKNYDPGLTKPVTINYTVHHHHGGEGYDEHRLAAIHRRHLDQMARDLAEVQYRNNRASFTSGVRSV